MIAIIGAGMAGLACAHQLATAGRGVVIFDKGRGLGGRIATRRTDFGSFDHGAQYATAGNIPFMDYLEELAGGGTVGRWPESADGRDRYVGIPGMTSLVKPLAAAVTVHRSTEITEISKAGAKWLLTDASGAVFGPFATIVLTPPAPQTVKLLADYTNAFPQLGMIAYAPCWTLMAAFDEPLEAARKTVRGDGLLSWVACNSDKPGRAGLYETWIAQASPRWSQDNLEREKDAVAKQLLADMFEVLDVPPQDAIFQLAHRWRYAQVETAVGQPYLFNAELQIGIAGDGMLGGRIEAAYESGCILGQFLSQWD